MFCRSRKHYRVWWTRQVADKNSSTRMAYPASLSCIMAWSVLFCFFAENEILVPRHLPLILELLPRIATFNPEHRLATSMSDRHSFMWRNVMLISQLLAYRDTVPAALDVFARHGPECRRNYTKNCNLFVLETIAAAHRPIASLKVSILIGIVNSIYTNGFLVT